MEALSSAVARPQASGHILSSSRKRCLLAPCPALARTSRPAFAQERPKTKRGRASVKTQALFGTKAPAGTQQYLCIDCGYIYDGRVPFDQLGKDYRCPVCNAPKRRFKAQPRSQKSSGKGSGRASGRQLQPQAASGEGIGSEDSSKLLAGGVGILVIVGAIWAFLNSQY